MKVSEITIDDIARYLRLEDDEYETSELEAIKTASINYISSYTNIPATSSDDTEIDLDDYEEFYIVVMILCQDMYDNRTMYVDGKELNRTVQTILDMHRRNLIAE